MTAETQDFEVRVNQFVLVMLAIRQGQDKANADFIAKLGNLSLQQLNVINVIGIHEPCTMTKVADNVLVSLSSVTLIVNKLVKMNIVKRKRSKEDRRVVYVELDEKGKKLFEMQVEHIQKRGRKLLGVLSEDEQIAFLNICQKFVME